jgi:hypothetical protein
MIASPQDSSSPARHAGVMLGAALSLQLALTLTLVAATISPALAQVRDNREKAWSLSTQLDLAHERGEQAPAVWKTPPSVVLPQSPMDSPDVRVTSLNNTTQSENSIAVSPLDNKVLLNSNNSTDWPVTQVLGTSWWFSTDGGLTWSGSQNGPGQSNRGDPAAVIDLSGKAYIGFIHNSGGMGVAFTTNMGAGRTSR